MMMMMKFPRSILADTPDILVRMLYEDVGRVG